MSRPKIEFSAGGVKATIWENEREREGETYTTHSIQIKRVYRDEQDQWQETDYFGVNDLPKVVAVASKAYEHLLVRQRVPDQEAAGFGGSSGPPRPPADPNAPLSDQQRRAIANLSQRAGLDQAGLGATLSEVAGCQSVDELSFAQAAEVIKRLQQHPSA